LERMSNLVWKIFRNEGVMLLRCAAKSLPHQAADECSLKK
jgi:hypothetical protein